MKRFSILLGLSPLLFSCTAPRPEAAPVARTAPPARASTGVPMAVVQRPEDRAHSEAIGDKFILSTEGAATTAAAREILSRGGNLVDAAVAASFAISVERPQSTGIGGGGFLLFHRAPAKGRPAETLAFDFRERAPGKAHRDLFLDRNGNVIPNLSTDGILAVGVPGLVAGLLQIQEKFGVLPLGIDLQPAIDLAENGFLVYPHLARALAERRDVLTKFPASREVFLKPDGRPWQVGEKLVQKDLAETLRQIARLGTKAFYQGEIAQAIARESARLGGILDAKDLADYQVKLRHPVTGSYKGYEIVSMPPPSSGGIHVIEILQTLESDPMKELGLLSAQAIHLFADASRLAFADRSVFLGDPDFHKVPVAMLTSREYAKKLRGMIPADRELPESLVHPGARGVRAESEHTTHFSMMDSEGNVISSTQTINGSMGSGVVVPGTGILLNNEMDDFSAKPGAANLYGAIGGDANSIAPGKTPLSSMAPTIVLKDGNPVMAVGAPGGTRIISCVAQTLLNYLGFGLSLYDSVAAVRVHDQWKPATLAIDAPGPGAPVVASLGKMGYPVDVAPNAVACHVMAVSREGDILRGVADPRDIGTSTGL